MLRKGNNRAEGGGQREGAEGRKERGRKDREAEKRGETGDM